MSVDFYIGEGMMAPNLTATLTNPDGTALNLDTTPVPTVSFTMRREAQLSPLIVTGVTIVDAAAGDVSVGWADGDTDVPGRYRGYFTITYADGELVRCPGDAALLIVVTPA